MLLCLIKFAYKLIQFCSEKINTKKEVKYLTINKKKKVNIILFFLSNYVNCKTHTLHRFLMMMMMVIT